MPISSNIKTIRCYSSYLILVFIWKWRLLAHVVAGVGNTFELPLADVLIPVDVLLDHLLQTPCRIHFYQHLHRPYRQRPFRGTYTVSEANLEFGWNELVDDKHLESEFLAELTYILQKSLHLPLVLLLQVGDLWKKTY